MITTSKIIHYPRVGKRYSWSSTGTVLREVIDFQCSEGIKTKKDTFQIILKKYDSLPSFKVGDKIVVFARNFKENEDIVDIDETNQTSFSASFLFQGVINEIPSKFQTKHSVTLQGSSLNESLFKMMLPPVYNKDVLITIENSDGTTSRVTPTAKTSIQNLIYRVWQFGGTHIYWDYDLSASTKEDGSSFEPIVYSKNYTPVYSQIEELSGESYTGDGEYYSYIYTDSTGKTYFVWKKKLTEYNNASETLVEGTDFYFYDNVLGVWDAFNIAIMNAGNDPRGHAMWRIVYSESDFGIGMKYFPIQLTDAIIVNERKNNSTKFETDTLFIKDTEYPYTTNFVVEENDSIESQKVYKNGKFYNEIDFVDYSGGDYRCVIDNDDEWVDFVRFAAGMLAYRKGKLLTKKYGRARFKLNNVALPYGSKQHTLGQTYKIRATSYGWGEGNEKKLRLVERNHYINKKGWSTTLKFEQDWEAVWSETSGV